MNGRLIMDILNYSVKFKRVFGFYFLIFYPTKLNVCHIRLLKNPKVFSFDFDTCTCDKCKGIGLLQIKHVEGQGYIPITPQEYKSNMLSLKRKVRRY